MGTDDSWPRFLTGTPGTVLGNDHYFTSAKLKRKKLATKNIG